MNKVDVILNIDIGKMLIESLNVCAGAVVRMEVVLVGAVTSPWLRRSGGAEVRGRGCVGEERERRPATIGSRPRHLQIASQ